MNPHLLSISSFKTLSARLRHAVVVADYLTQQIHFLQMGKGGFTDLPASEQKRIRQLGDEFKTAFSDAQMDTATIRPDQIIEVQAQLESLVHKVMTGSDADDCYASLQKIMETLQIEISPAYLKNKTIDMENVNAFYLAQSTGENELQPFSVFGMYDELTVFDLYDESKQPFVDHELALNQFHAIGMSALSRNLDSSSNPCWIGAIPGELQLNKDYADLERDTDYRNQPHDGTYALVGVDSDGDLFVHNGFRLEDGNPNLKEEEISNLDVGFVFAKSSAIEDIEFAAEKYAVDISDILAPDLVAALAEPGQGDGNPFGPPDLSEEDNDAETSMNP
jgi:hypothetical protein